MLSFLFLLYALKNVSCIGFDEFYQGISRELHVYEKNQLCRLFRADTELYLQYEDNTFEWTKPERVMRYDKSCPYEGELCFKANNFSYAFVSLSCNKLGHIVKTPLGEYRFLMSYDMVRFDHIAGNLYFLLKPDLYVFHLDNFLEILKNKHLPHNAIDTLDIVIFDISKLEFDHIIRLNLSSNWMDFIVSDGSVLFTEDSKLFKLEDNEWKSHPLTRVNSYYFPFVMPSTSNGHPSIHLIFYLLEFVVIILLVYLCRVHIRKTSSAMYISPPYEGPYVEKPLVEQKV